MPGQRANSPVDGGPGGGAELPPRRNGFVEHDGETLYFEDPELWNRVVGRFLADGS